MKYLIAISILIFLFSCKENKKAASQTSDVFYTCSMHPQIMESKVGTCPICGMDLIAVQKNKGPKTGELMLSDQQIQLGNIQTDTIHQGVIGNKVVLTATLNVDQLKTTAVSARIKGRIEKLYYKNIGDYVSKGSPLLELYSEELNNAKQEYLLAIERQKLLDNAQIDFDQLITSAKNKLLLWGMTQAQIEELRKTKRASSTTILYSTAGGYITALNIKEGDYIMEGSVIINLADLSTLWAEAQVYTTELATIHSRATAIVQISHMPDKKIIGKIAFVNPEINPATRINLVRVSIPNPGNQLKAGMPAYVILENPKAKALVLPIDAVIRNGNKTIVWIKTSNNTFKSKTVLTGLESDNQIEITSGLQEGDIIVIKGAYLLQSENIFRNGNSSSGHDMHNM